MINGATDTRNRSRGVKNKPLVPLVRFIDRNRLPRDASNSISPLPFGIPFGFLRVIPQETVKLVGTQQEQDRRCFQPLRIRFRVPSRGSTSGKDAAFHRRSRSRCRCSLSSEDSRSRTTLPSTRRCHCSPTLSVKIGNVPILFKSEPNLLAARRW